MTMDHPHDDELHQLVDGITLRPVGRQAWPAHHDPAV